MTDDPTPRSDAHVLGTMLLAALAAWAFVFAVAAWDIGAQMEEGRSRVADVDPPAIVVLQ